MNIHIITSSYPATPDDPSGTAGLFVRDFALELARSGHTVVVQPTARKKEYVPDPSLMVEPTPWIGGDRELASINLLNPCNWPIFGHYFYHGITRTREINARYRIDRTLCMWVVPSGLFAFIAQRATAVPYDVWALGSDIWKIRKIPFFGKRLIRSIMKNAGRIFADGVQLARDVEEIAGIPCGFLPTSRKLPEPVRKMPASGGPGLTHFLFVGRYHANKGPDLLVNAVALLSPEIRASIRVSMFGLGPLEKKLKELVMEMQLAACVSVNGPIKAQEVADYLAGSSFLVIPSRIESIPVVFSDALQIGTPVVAMPVGDLGPLIQKYECGIVAEEVGAHALAAALTRAAASDKSSYRAGVAHACEQFRIENTVRKWLESGS